MEKKGVICLGEALIDFIPLDDTNIIYQKSPGGAPANVSVGLARLGVDTTFIGMVGDDILGRFLEETLQRYGVDTKRMQFSTNVRTGVVFVTNSANGERSFDFYIKPSADQFLHAENLVDVDFHHHKIFHFGSISMISHNALEATQYAIDLAQKNDMIISFDPNIRLSLWESEEAARRTVLSVINHVDVLKLSEEELQFLTGEKQLEKAVRQLENYEIALIFVTLGEKGSYVFTGDGFGFVEAIRVHAVDTTGAGDAYVSSILYSLNKDDGDIYTISCEQAMDMARLASVSGALAASKKGAMTALPTLSEVLKYKNE